MKETVIFSWVFGAGIIIYILINDRQTKKKEEKRRVERDELKDDLIECKTDLTEEQILWRKYGKGMNFDNISILKKRIYELEEKIRFEDT